MYASNLGVSGVFWLRPNSVWGFQPGDVTICWESMQLIIFVRVCKRWPELVDSPARRAVSIPAARMHPRRMLIDGMQRAADYDPL